jgi:hypothetical protein
VGLRERRAMSIISVIQAIVRNELQQLHLGELGVVTSIFPHKDANDKENYECNVLLKNSGLELRKVPVATPVIGGTAIPNVDDLVLVTFVGGDANQPIIVGRLYNKEQRPPANKPDEIAFHLPLDVTDSDALVLAMRSGGDHDPKRQVQVLMGSKLKIELADGDPPVAVETDQVKIQVAADGGVKIETQGKLEIKASKGLDLKSDGNIGVEASGALKLKGATIDLN